MTRRKLPMWEMLEEAATEVEAMTSSGGTMTEGVLAFADTEAMTTTTQPRPSDSDVESAVKTALAGERLTTTQLSRAVTFLLRKAGFQVDDNLGVSGAEVVKAATRLAKTTGEVVQDGRANTVGRRVEKVWTTPSGVLARQQAEAALQDRVESLYRHYRTFRSMDGTWHVEEGPTGRSEIVATFTVSILGEDWAKAEAERLVRHLVNRALKEVK